MECTSNIEKISRAIPYAPDRPETPDTFEWWRLAERDDQIGEEVYELLERDAIVNPFDVDVRVDSGRILLYGIVPSHDVKRRIDRLLGNDSVEGITGVENRVAVRSTDPSRE